MTHPTEHPNSATSARDDGGRSPDSITELLARLSADTASLIHDEVELARSETVRKAKEAALGAGLLAGAGVLGLGALVTGTATLIRALERPTGPVRAALLVTAGYGAAAGALAAAGLAGLRRAAPLVPEQAVESMKEDVAWARSLTS